MRHLTLAEVLELHAQVVSRTGGSLGLRDLGLLESAVAQPRQTFAGQDLYGDLPAKSGALGFSLIANHPFVDGNKRVGHAAMEAFLMLNGHELHASVDDAEEMVLRVASGKATRDALIEWLRTKIVSAQG